METNELPEEVKAKIEEIPEKLGWPNDGTAEANDIKKAAEFGYRLGLPSCEEELKAKDEEIAKLKLQNNQAFYADKVVLVENIDSLTSAIEAVRSVVNLEPKMDGVLLGSCDRKKAGNALHNLFSLLSQSTIPE